MTDAAESGKWLLLLRRSLGGGGIYDTKEMGPVDAGRAKAEPCKLHDLV